MPLRLASTRAGHGGFSAFWCAEVSSGADQKIVDAVRDLLESKEINARNNGDKRTILG
ncbi:hypothetical protein [Corynebacterium pseudodiphtheriticum]|uniref:hypothetical protein n=1 Tax=Corynebacterium pseudodiphtheriticum TaxID=37637 RepID=UPI00234C5C13|nr:hypothetical protein [Corynebacterium pseudodiphtheriticum]MDC7089407.1 hypothetical protein [Corynebacterium pseudodiphtheriticum]MDK4322589.1 hypothetical protein [Corynebacterium pseudodiphtheriticum]